MRRRTLFSFVLLLLSTTQASKPVAETPPSRTRPYGSSWWPPSELSDDTACQNVVNDTTLSPYRRAIPISNLYNISTHVSVFQPVFSSVPILETEKGEEIKLAVIYIHGLAAGYPYTGRPAS